MVSKKAKRFYKSVDFEPQDDGYGVLLDGRSVRTPLGNAMVLPTHELVKSVVAEWDGQGDEINPLSMPQMRLACTAIDKVAPVHGQVVSQIVRYGQSDLLCYWAERPDDLVARQTAAWQPVLDWLAESKGVALNVTVGIVPVSQPEESLSALDALVSDFDAFRLAALGEITQLTGSLALALACMDGRLDEMATLDASRLDEDWQIEQWGLDYEAEDRRKSLEADFSEAIRFFRALA